MRDQNTRPDLVIGYRARPMRIFNRTMRIVAIGSRVLLDYINQREYDEAIHVARRMSNIWLEGHYAYQLVLIDTDESVNLAENHQRILDRQHELVALLHMLRDGEVSERVRLAAEPLCSLLSEIRLPNLSIEQIPLFMSPRQTRD